MVENFWDTLNAILGHQYIRITQTDSVSHILANRWLSEANIKFATENTNYYTMVQSSVLDYPHPHPHTSAFGKRACLLRN